MTEGTTFLLQGQWLINAHGDLKKGSLAISKDDKGKWHTPDGGNVEVCDLHADNGEMRLAILWGDDEDNAPFFPDPGELERAGIQVSS